jgi:hypothetical protein
MNRIPQTFRFKLVNGSLEPSNKMEFANFSLFLKSLEENEEFSITYEAIDSDKSYAQLSKAHKMIRELANFTGTSFEDMKIEIKIKAGLISSAGYKSFADCSKEEMSGVIQTCLEIGDFVGFSLR